MSPSSPFVTEDWSQFDPAAYLDEYYGDLGSENLALMRFLAEACRNIPSGGRLLDFGGGPAIYPLISAVTCADEIHFSDYLQANLDEVARWIGKAPGAFDWDPFIQTALELESGTACSAEEVHERASQIRQRVTRLLRCDASCAAPLQGATGEPYDIVMTNFCAESATADRVQWHVYMSNIVSVLKPGGWLVISALKGASRYSVGDASFPAVEIFEDDLVELLDEAGFSRKCLDVQSVAADRPTRDYQGLIFAAAQKTPARTD